MKYAVATKKRPSLARLLEMEVGPKTTIEAHELEIECLFEAVDRDANRSLDLDEVRFFVKQYIEMCNK